LAGGESDNLLLESKDRIIVHHNVANLDPAIATVEGEVANPGKYLLSSKMTAAALVRLAGGFKRGAYTENADLASYTFKNGERLNSEHRTVAIAKAIAGLPGTDVLLHDHDVLTIGQLSGWRDMGAMVTVQGEVVHPGSYGIADGERLSSVIRRAGGFSSEAYPYG